MQRLATALLAAMALLFVTARALEGIHPAWPWVRAFAEAALVGGLADWFAVTALFRHPLGLPIPHTAIIPANKDRIGDAFADFLERHFLTRDVLGSQLAEADIAAAVANWLLDPVQRRWLAAQAMHALASKVKPGPLLADWLAGAMAQGMHDQLFDRLLDAAARLLDEQSDPIYRKVSEKSPRWMPRRFNDEFFVRLMDGLTELLDEMRVGDSDARQRFAQAARDLRERLAAGELDDALAHHWRHAGLPADQLAGLPERLPEGQPGWLAVHAEHGLAEFARQLAADIRLRERLNRWARRQAVILLVRQRRRIVGLVRRVVQGWDPQSVATRVEGYVGRDLQYIRINGTMVGGLVGLALQALSGLF